MDKNKNALEELKNLLSSVNEVISQQFFEMQQKIDLLEQKVAQLENMLNEKSELEKSEDILKKEYPDEIIFDKGFSVNHSNEKVEDMPVEVEDKMVYKEEDNEKSGEKIEVKVEDVVEEEKVDGLLDVDGFELDDNEEVPDEVVDDLGEDVIGEEDLVEGVVEEEEDFNEEHIGEEEEAEYGKEDFEIEEDSKELVLDKVKPDWYDWEVDYPGTHLDDISYGIGYNDRLIFIKELFYNSEDEYKRTIAELNGMEKFRDAMAYIRTNFPNWNEESEEVYRFYMNVRRKLK